MVRAPPLALKRSPIDMFPLVRATASLLSEHPALRHIDVHVDGGGPLVFADPDMLKVVFTTKSRGAGLGLPTVKRFVEAHSGQIEIDCPPAGGTTVLIGLPMGTA